MSHRVIKALLCCVLFLSLMGGCSIFKQEGTTTSKCPSCGKSITYHLLFIEDAAEMYPVHTKTGKRECGPAETYEAE